MAETIVITSGKGGVGKTTICANIGMGLALNGYKVVMIDGDTGLRNLDISLGLSNRVIYTYPDIFEGKCTLRQAIVRDKRLKNLFLLPTSQTKEIECVTAQQMLELTEELSKIFDYILIDSPAGIDYGFENAVVGANRAFVVVNPDITSIRDADRVINKLNSRGLIKQYLIVNRIDYNMMRMGKMIDLADIVDNLPIKLLGVIQNDDAIISSINKGEPVIFSDNNKTNQDFKNIVKAIMGEKVSCEWKMGNKSVLPKIKRLFSSV